jgi:hypothetical protein
MVRRLPPGTRKSGIVNTRIPLPISREPPQAPRIPEGQFYADREQLEEIEAQLRRGEAARGGNGGGMPDLGDPMGGPRDEDIDPMDEGGGGDDAPLYDQNLLDQPAYEDTTIQAINDMAADEAFPVIVAYVNHHSRLGKQTKARLIVRAAAFESKNHVLSYLTSQNDLMAAQDDFQMVGILSKADMTSMDMTSDFFTAETLVESQHNIRLRRSREALNLLQITTRRSETVMTEQRRHEEKEEKGLRRRIPILGNL